MRCFFLAAFVSFMLPATLAAQEMTAWHSAGCSCCQKWAEHMNKQGFQVTMNDSGDLDAIRKKFGIPPEQASCHVAKIGDYAIEGHVPAEDVRRLLDEKPDAVGLAVPGMHIGSPGMEAEEGQAAEAYDVLLVRRDGSTEIFHHYDAAPAAN